MYFSSEFKVCHSHTVRNSVVYSAKEILTREQADVTVMQFLFTASLLAMLNHGF